MALAIIITLEKELADFRAVYAKSASGKALARELDRLDLAARSCHVTPITGLLSESHAALAKQMEAEGFDVSKMRLPAEQWFAATEGLKTIRGLLARVEANLNDFKFPNPILRDLRTAEALMIAAEANGVRFHFTKADV